MTRFGLVVLAGLVGCSLEEESSKGVGDRDDPDAAAVDTLSNEINCPDVVDLVACLPFDGTTTDTARNHDIAVLSGDTDFIPGASRTALQLTSEVLAPFDAAGDFEVASATIEMWLGPSPGTGFVFDYDQRLSVQVAGENTVRCVAQTPEGDRSASARLDFDRWNHVACVFGTERGIEMYVDRTMVDQNPSATQFMPSPSRTAHLGSDSPGGGGAFTGIVDNLRIWQRNISAEDLCLECAHIRDPNE